MAEQREKQDGDIEGTQTPAIVDVPEDVRISATDIKELRHVRDSLPTTVWAAAIMGMAERFAFYGASQPFQNYLQNSINDPFRPGVLGMGQANATMINYAFITFGFMTPVPMAIIADKWLGRFRAIWMSILIELLGCFLLVITSLPPLIDRGAAAPGLAVSMVLIGVGVGGVKTAVSPFVADQYTELSLKTKILKSGERVIVDRTLTMQYIYNMYYWMINIGSLAGLATPFLEKYVSFWAAYLLPFLMLWVSVIILFLLRNRFVCQPIQGNIVPMTFLACFYACRDGFKLDSARPAVQLERRNRTVSWDDKFIDDLKRALLACRVGLGFPIFWLCWGQAFNNLISQAGQMEAYGLPNDLFKTLNPIACIVFGPVLQNMIYPFLNARKIPFPPIARIAVGYFFMAASLAIAAGIQHLVYSQGPCYDMPLDCPAGKGGTVPNAVNVFLQTPVYVSMAFSELLSLTTGYEYAYSKAPARMKSFVQAMSVFMAGIGSAIGMAISPTASDPNLTNLYASLTAVMAANTFIFWLTFRKLDKIDEQLNSAVISGDKDNEAS